MQNDGPNSIAPIEFGMRRLRFSLFQLLVAVALIAVILGVVDWYRQSSRTGEIEVDFLRIAFSADGRTINVPAVAYRYREDGAPEVLSGAVVILDAATGRTLRTVGGFSETPIALSPDKALLLTNKGFDLVLRDFPSTRKRAVLKGHRNGIEGAAFSPDGRTLVTGSLDDTLRVWDVPTGKLRCHMALPAAYLAPTRAFDFSLGRFAFSHDGNVLAVSSLGTLSLWETTGYRRTATFRNLLSTTAALAFSADDDLLVAGGNYGLRVFGAAPLQVVSQQPAGFIVDIAAAPNDEFLAIAELSRKVWLADLKTGKPVCTVSQMLSTSAEVTSIAVSPDGQTLAIGTDKHVWGFERVEDAAKPGEIKFAQRFVTPIALTISEPLRIRWLFIVGTGAVLLMCASVLRRRRNKRERRGVLEVQGVPHV